MNYEALLAFDLEIRWLRIHWITSYNVSPNKTCSINHSSFLLVPALGFVPASACIFTSFFPCSPSTVPAAVTRSAHSEAIASDISDMTLPQAIAQMLTLMLPSGALGKDRTHSA
jgi:hypothetical protein